MYDMAGLIRKDMYCLRKNLKIFLTISIGVVLIAVLFFQSAEHGNIAKGIEEMKIENNMGEEVFYSFFQMAVLFTLFLPASLMTMITECFKEDRKAGFTKQMLSLPLSDEKLVGSRYISCIIISVISLADSVLAGFFVSLASKVFPFGKLLGYVCCFNGILLIYMSIELFLIYTFGAEKADLIQCVPIIILLLLTITVGWQKVSALTEEQVDAYFTDLINGFSNFMIEKWGILILIAICCMALSFLGSCKIFKRRKENI